LLNGILNINKPYGLTSHDVIYKIRRVLNIKKAGHAGTLDPMATGVVAVCLGKSTKLIQYLPKDKEYLAEITLGITTDTYDAEGKTISNNEVKLDINQLEIELKKFHGEIMQQVPQVSATHYKGKKLYEYAHKGITITDLPSKIVTIYDLQLLDIINKEEKHPVICIKIKCGTGTYIRSIANDLGNALGYGAHLSKLTRTLSSGLNLETSTKLEDLEKYKIEGSLNNIIINPVDIIELPKYQVVDSEIKKILNGQNIPINAEVNCDSSYIVVINENSELICIGKLLKEEHLIKPETVVCII
jgi:tRNA pseudouridine55 synthase